MNEHDHEPIPGLPATLPPGEAILWQGGPRWDALAIRAMRVRSISIYFVALLVWGVVSGLTDGAPASQVALHALRLAALATAAVGLLALFAWLVSRTTVYTITTRRVVIRFGISLPITVQIPFTQIDGAGLRAWADGAGDIALSLRSDQRIAYLVLWPHTRPWKLTRAEPSLRAVPDAARVAQILGRALTAAAAQPAHAVTVRAADGVADDARLPAAA